MTSKTISATLALATCATLWAGSTRGESQVIESGKAFTNRTGEDVAAVDRAWVDSCESNQILAFEVPLLKTAKSEFSNAYAEEREAGVVTESANVDLKKENKKLTVDLNASESKRKVTGGVLGGFGGVLLAVVVVLLIKK